MSTLPCNIDMPRRGFGVAIESTHPGVVTRITKNKKCEHQKRKSECKDCKGSSICEHQRVKYNCKECQGSNICEHQLIKCNCKICNSMAFCKHQRRKSRCKDCKGSSICKHQRVESECKVCKGSRFCQHQKRKSECKECQGSSICVHQRVKFSCKDCKGSSICEHLRRRNECKECKGSRLCEHQKVKSSCKECNGSSFCEHQRRKSQCKDCKGGSICEHQREKSRCKQCKGSQICEHMRDRSSCKECHGSQICLHLKLRTQCRECKGSAFCIHEKRKSQCKVCKGSEICEHLCQRHQCTQCLRCSTHLCDSVVFPSNGSTSGYTWKEVVGGQKPYLGTEIYNTKLAAALEVKVHFNVEDLQSFEDNFFYDSYIKVKNTYYAPGGTCRRCHRVQQITSNCGFAKRLRYLLHKRGIVTKPLPNTGERKKKEMKIKDTLDQNDINYVNDVTVIDRDSSCEKTLSRPDFQVQHTHQELVNIHLEVDENQHKSYDSTCELVRLNDIAISHQYRRPIVVLRYNPDTFTVGSHRITCKQLSHDDKEKILMQQLKNLMEAAASPETFPPLLRVIKIGYNCKCQTTTECGFVHVTDYPDQESIRREYDLMQ